MPSHYNTNNLPAIKARAEEIKNMNQEAVVYWIFRQKREPLTRDMVWNIWTKNKNKIKKHPPIPQSIGRAITNLKNAGALERIEAEEMPLKKSRYGKPSHYYRLTPTHASKQISLF